MCLDVDLKGDVTIGSGARLPLSLLILQSNQWFAWKGTVVHPKATIFAMAGPIVIGAGCIIEESVIIVNRFVPT